MLQFIIGSYTYWKPFINSELQSRPLIGYCTILVHLENIDTASPSSNIEPFSFHGHIHQEESAPLSYET